MSNTYQIYLISDSTGETLDRVFGSNDKNSSEIIFKILSIVTKKVHIASNYKVAELVKFLSL